jgi:hypothetical protein
MKLTEAKKLLEFYRPGQPVTPDTAQALALLKTNPQLAIWHDQEKSLDKTLHEAIASIPVPANLRESLLLGAKIINVAPWWRRRVPLRAAAALLLLLAIGAMFLAPNPHTFVAYRSDVIEESWGRFPHLDIDTTDIQELNRWAAAHHMESPVTLPAGLKDMTVRGGRILEWNHHPVVLVCLTKGGKHVHLFATHNSFPDAPTETQPDYEKCNGWKTVSWRHGDHTFVLTGMNYYTFLKKFRHSGQWQIDG